MQLRQELPRSCSRVYSTSGRFSTVSFQTSNRRAQSTADSRYIDAGRSLDVGIGIDVDMNIDIDIDIDIHVYKYMDIDIDRNIDVELS